MTKKYLKYVLPKILRPGADIANPRDPTKGLGLRSFYSQAGVGCLPTLKKPPVHNIAPSERVLTGQTNACITLGVDRPGNRTTGYGGKGQTGAGAINLCAGSMGAYARSRDDSGKTFYANPSYVIDAARFNMSQKSDPDKNLDLPEGSIGSVSGKSAAVMKADAIRMVSRDGGMKLVTGVGNRDSQGQRILELPGIDLCSGGDDQGLQPIVLGTNLIEALEFIMNEIDDLRETSNSFTTYQREFNSSILSHNHMSPFFGIQGAPSITLIYEGIKAMFKTVANTETSLVFMGINKATGKSSYFNPVAEKYILSALNNVN